MKIETKRAYQEVYCILEQMPEEYTEKLPDKMKELIEYSRDKSYKPKIDLSKDLTKQGLSDKAVNILAVLYYKYWTISDVEKKELYEFLMMETRKNEKKKEYEAHKFRIQQGPVKEEIDENKIVVKEDNETVKNSVNRVINNSYRPQVKVQYEVHPNYYPVVKEKKSFFRRLLDKLKSIFN